MNKKLLLVLLSVLFIPGINAFAQFKMVAESPRNLKNLERVVMRSIKGPAIGRPVVTLPRNIVVGNKIGLLRVKMPQVVTPVTKSYINLLNNSNAKEVAAFVRPDGDWSRFVVREWVNREPVLYKSQTALARALDDFYGGQADVYIGKYGTMVKLYMLPVDGILYKPERYEKPIVLNSKDYFVIYDVQTQIGQIVENKPEVYNQFQQPVNKLQERYLQMQQIRISETYKQAWQQFYRGYMRSNSLPTALCKFYTMHPELLHTGLTTIVEKSTGKRFMVLEPVLNTLVGKDEVFLYFLEEPEQKGISVLRSHFLDNSDWYEVIE